MHSRSIVSNRLIERSTLQDRRNFYTVKKIYSFERKFYNSSLIANKKSAFPSIIMIFSIIVFKLKSNFGMSEKTVNRGYFLLI